MRGIIAIIGLVLTPLSAPVHAGGRPVVVELFTSQGCSSCPKADAILTELSHVDGIIPLALHVDYWDYLGWKDSFASPEYSKRQRAYATAANKQTIYTPQVIVQGVSHAIGNKRSQVESLIHMHEHDAKRVSLKIEQSADQLILHLTPIKGAVGPQVVELVRYIPEKTITIKAGENAGKRFTYTNIVTSWIPLGEWTGADATEIQFALSGPETAVILVQSRDNGPIMAAMIVP